MKNLALWHRLTTYEFDDPQSTLPFSQRLANENGWSLEYAKRVMVEYIKFVYLAFTLGFPVTPSDEVDQVWHLHMIYSRDYEDFCRNVLQKPFHHGPTRGGEKEDVRYADQYEKTKLMYVTTFRNHPPKDIWPTSEVRFGKQFIRIDVDDHLVIKKSDFPLATKVFVGILELILKFKPPSRKGLS